MPKTMTLNKKQEALANLEAALAAMKTSYHFAGQGKNAGAESLPLLQLMFTGKLD